MSRVENCQFVGDNRLYRDVTIKNTSLGKYSYVGRGSHIQNAEIGCYCSVGPQVLIGGGYHEVDKRSTHPLFQDHKDYSKKVIIGNDVWIGQGAIILDGVKIGNGAVIAAGSVVSHNVKAFKIVGGVPATGFGERKVQDESWYNG